MPLRHTLFWFGLCAVLLLGCKRNYPHPRIKTRLSPAGPKTVQFVYPTPKMTAIIPAFGHHRWGVLVAINDISRISFPPPGAIIDTRWMLHFAVLDQEGNPITKSPVPVASYERKEVRLSGLTMSSLATDDGFLVVYYRSGYFWYQKLTPSGQKVGSDKKFLRFPRRERRGSACRTLLVAKGSLYLLIQEPPKGYHSKFAISLVRHRLSDGKTFWNEKFLVASTQWPGANRIKALVEGDTLHLGLIGAAPTGRSRAFTTPAALCTPRRAFPPSWHSHAPGTSPSLPTGPTRSRCGPETRSRCSSQ